MTEESRATRTARFGFAFWQRFASLFAGKARGAAFIEYLLVGGVVALGAILAFQRFKNSTAQRVGRQAEVVRTLGPLAGGPLAGGPLLGGGPGGVTPIVGIGDGKTHLPVLQKQCFAAGTPVATETGLRSIESISVGDRVWGRDARTGTNELARVVERFVTRDQPVLQLTIPIDGLRSERIRVTPEHPFWVPERGWVAAADLGAEPLGAAFGTRELAATESWGERETVYNLEVERLHTYFVGESLVLVHNNCFYVVKTYYQWNKERKTNPNLQGYQINHLNQDAVYGKPHGNIPYSSGAAIPLCGGTNTPGGEHYRFHESLEEFWDEYRSGGDKEGELPTNAEYGAAMEKALIHAGIPPADAARMAQDARSNRIKYNHLDDDPVPRIPGRMNLTKPQPGVPPPPPPVCGGGAASGTPPT